MKRINKSLAVIFTAVFIFVSIQGFAFAADQTVKQGDITYTLYGSGTNSYYAVTDALKCTGDITIPSEIDGIPVKKINTGSFAKADGSGSSRITSVTIPSSVNSIGAQAFNRCYQLKIVDFEPSDSNVTFGNEAFIGCNMLESIIMPTKITTIPEKCFQGCVKLKIITIPEGVTRINKEAFLQCSALTTVTIPSTVTSIGNGAFYNCTSLTKFVVLGGNSYKTVNGVLFTYDSKTLVQYPCGLTVDSYTVPSGTETIGYGAFAFSSLKSIVLPESILKIDKYAFSDCEALYSINIPDKVKIIDSDAFLNCKALKKVVIPASVTDYNNAFPQCGLESVVIKNGCTSISTNAFDKCNSLVSVTIPASVISIGSGAIPFNENLVLKVTEGSYALDYAKENNIDYEITTCAHDETVIKNAVSASCTEKGYTGDTYCDLCGELIKAGKSVNATGHKDNNSDGVCDNCGYVTDKNAILKNAVINVPASKTIRWKYRAAVNVQATGIPSGYMLALYDGNTLVKKGDNTSLSYTTGSLTADKTLTAKIIDSDNNIVSTSAQEKSFTVKIDSGFFTKIISFFARLFGSDIVNFWI